MGAEVWHLLLFFFFKQKTAYEMRISDWSSDVLLFRSPWTGVMRCGVSDGAAVSMPHLLHASSTAAHGLRDARSNLLPLLKMWSRTSYMDNARSGRASAILECVTPRSEEHTSELQSLMRISYAVFCLKKKKTKHKRHIKLQIDK